MCYASHLTNVVTDKVVCRAYFAPERLLFFAELEASAWSVQKVYVFKLRKAHESISKTVYD